MTGPHRHCPLRHGRRDRRARPQPRQDARDQAGYDATAPHRFHPPADPPMTTRKTTTPMTPDPPHVERRSSWRDEHLDCICGLANGRSGVLDIGREVRREAIGATDLLRLAEEVPIKVRAVLSIVVNVHVRSDRGRDYLRIVVPSHLDRALPERSARKQPENPDQPENSQKTTRRPPENAGVPPESGTASSPSCGRARPPAAVRSLRRLKTPARGASGIRSTTQGDGEVTPRRPGQGGTLGSD